MEPGLYLTFFTEGEAFDRELPPVGPLEHVVVRDRLLMADRKDGETDLAIGGRLVEAERELRRATGQEPGGATRPDLRIGAPEGVYLRFVSFGETAEHDSMPELGPYAVVVVGRRGVEADGDPLATRTASGQNLWELTGVGGSAFVGVIRPDIAFRTRSTTYHPGIKPFRPGALPVVAPAAPAAATVAVRSAPPPQTTARPPEDPGLTLRDRIGTERPVDVRAAVEDDSREWGGAAWRLRYFIIGALVVLLVVFSVPSIRSLFTTGTAAVATVGVGTSLTAPDWTYNVGSVRRVTTIGTATARGTYLVVQVAAANRGNGGHLQPSNFSLIAATGEEYAAQPATSNVYLGASNPNGPYTWPTDFPVGRAVLLPLIFEVSPAITGTQLVILDVPTTRVRLE